MLQNFVIFHENSAFARLAANEVPSCRCGVDPGRRVSKSGFANAGGHLLCPAGISSGMMAGVRRDRVRRDRVVYAMSAGKKDILESAGINTRLGHLGNDRWPFTVSSIRPSFMPRPCFSQCRGIECAAGQAAEIHLRNAWDADNGMRCAKRSTLWKALRHCSGALRSRGGDVAVPGLSVGRRSRSDRRFRLFPDSPFLRRHAETARCQRRLFRSGDRRRYRGLIRPNTRLVHLEARAAPIHSRCRMSRRSSRSLIGTIALSRSTIHGPRRFTSSHWTSASTSRSTRRRNIHRSFGCALGTVSANARHWPALTAAYTSLGLCVGPDDAYQILRGLRTMGVRLEHHQRSALKVAQWLEGRADVAAVLHPPCRVFPVTRCGSATSRVQAACFLSSSRWRMRGSSRQGRRLPQCLEAFRPRLFLGRV